MSLAVRNGAFDGPGARRQIEWTIRRVASQSGAQALLERALLIGRQALRVRTRRPLSEQERRPVVVERRKVLCHVQSRFADVLQSFSCPERGELALPAERHVALVARGGSAVDGGGLVP